MRNLSSCLIPVFAVALAACASGTTYSPQEGVIVQPAAATVTTVALPTEIATVHPAFITAWQGTDPAALRVYFGDNAVVVTPTGQFTGWSNIQTGWINTLLPNMKGYTATPVSFTRDGAVIVETGKYGYVLTRDGTPQNLSGTYTYRWQLQPDNTWRIIAGEIK